MSHFFFRFSSCTRANQKFTKYEFCQKCEKKNAIQIEYRYVERVDASIVGAQFLTARGIGFTLAQFENKTLPLFMIRKPNNVPLQIAQHIF